MAGTFMVGVGRSVITPEVGGMLQGYTPRRASQSVHDDLHLTAFLINQDDRKVILAAADLVGIPTCLSERLRQAMADASGVPFTNIILGTTHTHSGPVTVANGDNEPEDAPYFYNILLPGAIAAAKAAAESLQPAQMGIGVTESQVGVNRRIMNEQGTIDHGQDPLGLYDPAMTVVSFRDLEGKTIGNLVHYGAHNTASAINTAVTRDWCGVMIDRMDNLTGGITAFVNGCQGNCGPRLPNGKTTGDTQMAQELGGLAAIDGMRAWRSIRRWRQQMDLDVIYEHVTLPYAPLPTREELQKKLDRFSDPTAVIPERLMAYNGITRQLNFLDTPEAKETEQKIPICVIRLGPIAFVSLPFETFSQITMRIGTQSPFPYTLCLSNANGGNGYFASRDQITLGGYEIRNSREWKAHPYVVEADQHLVSGVTALLRELYQ